MPEFDFKPFSKKQKKAMTWWMSGSPVSGRDILIADGAIRSGKTVALINGFIDWSLAEFSDENFILVGKSMGALTKNVLNPLKRMLTTKGYDYYHVRTTAEPRIEIGSNKYYLYGANNVSSKDTLTGLTAAGSFADQVALFPENFVSTMIDRCSVAGSRHWWNCNPQGPKHYLKTDFIDKAKRKKIFRLPFRLDDNLTLSEEIKKRYKRLHSGMWYARNVEGKWIQAEGVIYENFSDEIVVDQLPDSFKKFWIGGDYGITNPTAFELIGLGSDNIFYLIDEYRHEGGEEGTSRKTDKEYSEDLQQFLREKARELDLSSVYLNPNWIWIDPSAAGLIQQLWRDRTSCPPLRKVKEANHEVVEGIQRLSSLISLGKFKVHRRCQGAIDEFHAYSWDPKAQERGEDKPIKQNDHSLDGLRYGFNGIAQTNLFRQVI